MLKYYAIYDRSDMIRFVGDADECSNWLHITKKSFFSRTFRRRKKKAEEITNSKFVVYEYYVEDEDND